MAIMKNELYPCACCERKTLSESLYGSYEICEHCNWENDGIQADDPNYAGGANSESLNQARNRLGKPPLCKGWNKL
jgi:hypothetical protein